MKIAGMLAAAVLVGGLGLGGCDKSRDEMRPDMDTVMSGEHGLQSRDLREMTDKMAPDLLAIPEISRNQFRVVVVMKPPENHTESERGRDMTIFVAKLKTLLNSSQTRDRIAFVEEQAALRNVQGQELGNPDPFEQAGRAGQNNDPRVKPQYVLSGKFYEKREARTSYYLCTFQLMDINTGIQVWEGSYDVRTLN